MRLERERISRDLHDSIGAYANAVLYKSELLQQEENVNERNDLIKDLRFASKDIITSLRETIWALKKIIIQQKIAFYASAILFSPLPATISIYDLKLKEKRLRQKSSSQ